ncbi:hypothetical protein T484DRAFT_1853785 [Baffinella frigidus]|nr:hypothetical protein T484DRAFT_1853785 [Cryptophyta sp. CCMP2293]
MKMKLEFRSKNLCINNDLELLHNGTGGGLRVPRVVFLCRSELFVGQKPESYRQLFSLSGVSGTLGGGQENEPLELKVASFSARLNEYLEQYCALRLRQGFEGIYSKFEPRDPGFRENVKFAHADHFPSENASSLGLLWAMTPGGKNKGQISASEEPHKNANDEASRPPKDPEPQKPVSGEDTAHAELLQGAAFLLTVGSRVSDPNAAEQLVKKMQASDIWTSSQFVERIGRVPGLMDLASTPFMVNIIVDIMPVKL